MFRACDPSDVVVSIKSETCITSSRREELCRQRVYNHDSCLKKCSIALTRNPSSLTKTVDVPPCRAYVCIAFLSDMNEGVLPPAVS
jgi:hypothetical protein